MISLLVLYVIGGLATFSILRVGTKFHEEKIQVLDIVLTFLWPLFWLSIFFPVINVYLERVEDWIEAKMKTEKEEKTEDTEHDSLH